MRRAVGGLLCWAALGCGGVESGASLDERAWRTADAQSRVPTQVALDAPVRALLADGERLFVATDSGVRIVLRGEAPTLLAPTRVEPDDPTVTGQVRSLAMRRDGTLLAAAEKGLFLWDGKQLTRSPVSALADSPERVALAVHGVERWAVSQGTRVLHSKGSIETLEMPEPVAGLAYTRDRLVVAHGTSLLLIGEDSDARFRPVDLDSGVIRGVVADLSGDLWVVTDDGLWCRHTSGSEVTWVRWETDDALGDAIADPDRPGVWVRSGASAVFASLSDETFAHAQVGGSGGPLAIAPSGVLWASEGSVLMGHSGWGAPPPSFAKEIAPFSSANCQACHGAAMSLPLVTHEEWLRNSQRILVNLRAGTMPRGAAMSASEFRIVTRWVEGGMLP